MFDAADLAVFVDPDMPCYVSAMIDGQPVAGLFRERYEEAFGIVGGTGPVLRVLDSVSVSLGSSVVVPSGSFTVSNIKPEMLGMQVLILEAA